MYLSEHRKGKGFFSYELGSRDAMIHNDHLGTPQKMTDTSGSVVWSADYKPFGEATITVSTITNNLRFPGQYFDAETGTHYNYYRDYNPIIGRYIEADPIGIEQGDNHLYVYVGNNPVIFIDPYGESFIGKIVVFTFKGGRKVVGKVRHFRDAARALKEGENVLCKSRRAAKEVAEAAGEGKRAIHEIDKKTGRAHYHISDRTGGHALYGIAAALTVSHYAEGQGSIAEGGAVVIDLINPLSLPNDILEIKDAIFGNED